jgi:hypothetical protein
MKPRKVYSLAKALTNSQLRASRSGRGGASLFRNPIVMLVIDAAAFSLAAGLGFAVTPLLMTLGEPFRSQFLLALREGLVFIPALIPGMILVAGVLFELSSSSKFASSDAVNWLPVTQSEYVAASILSCAYIYSVIPAVTLGFTLAPSAAAGYTQGWAAIAMLSLLTLILGGTLVEILRAAVNRVSSTVMKRARRGALVLRLIITVVIILIFQVIFNFVILIDVISAFASAASVTRFIPIFWASLAAQAVMAGDTFGGVAFTLATVLLTIGLIWVAAKVRSAYWSPVPMTVVVTTSEYAPRASVLSRLGLTVTEAALARKDLRGLVRRRELIQYFAIPIVLTAVLFIEVTFTSASAGTSASVAIETPVLFIGGLVALIISSISFGQEGRSVTVLYSLPVTPREILRAKAFTALLFALVTSCGMVLVLSLVTGSTLPQLLENLAVALSVGVEETFIGLGFGAKFPDFQERPRPRFLDPVGIIIMVIVGIAIAFVTALPIVVIDILQASTGAYFPYEYLFLASLAFAWAVSALAYRWARGGVTRLFSEYRA